jgi:flagellar basal-body rod protein FlgB
MIDQGIFGKTFSIIERALDILTLNHQIISMNVANVNTPNYRPLSLRFDEALRSYMVEIHPPLLIRTDERHLSPIINARYERLEPFIYEEVSYIGSDGNSVDEEREMVRLVENQLMYHSFVQILTRQFNAIRDAIKEGGR